MTSALRLSLFVLLAATTPVFAELGDLLRPVANAPGVETAESPALVAGNFDPVATGPRVLKSDELLTQLQAQLAEHFSISGDFQIALTRPWQPVKLPAADYKLTITQYPPAGLATAFFVQMKIESGGSVVAEGQLPLRAQLWQEVWAAANRLERGEAVQPSMLVRQKVDVLREKQALLPADADLAGYEVALSVPAGRIILKRDLVERPLVRKGQMVEAIATSGKLSVSLKALALENGAAGALIKVRNMDSRKEFNAEVTNENQVKVHF